MNWRERCVCSKLPGRALLAIGGIAFWLGGERHVRVDMAKTLVTEKETNDTFGVLAF